MKSSFNKNADPKSIAEFISGTLEKSQSWQDTLETMAIALLPALREARQDGTLEAKAASIPMQWDWLAENLDPFEIADTVQGVTPEAVKAFVAEATRTQDLPQDQLLKKAAQVRDHIASMDVEEYVAYCRAIESVYPPAMAAAAAASRAGKTLEEDARETHALASSLTAEEIAAQYAKLRASGAPEKVADAIYGVLQQTTPERFDALLTYFNENLGGAGVALLVKRFWEASEQVLEAAHDGDFMAPKNPAKVKAFGRALKDALTAAEEGLQHAGYELPENFGAMLAQVLDATQTFRQAAGQRGAAEMHKGAGDEIAVNKPLQFKKPGNGFSL